MTRSSDGSGIRRALLMPCLDKHAPFGCVHGPIKRVLPGAQDLHRESHFRKI
jgi:hypothetical protein